MTIRKAAFSVIILVLGFLAVACGGRPISEDSTSAPIETLSVQMDHAADINKIESAFTSIKSVRGVSEGWAVDVRPGSTRSTETIIGNLTAMEHLQEDLHRFGSSDRVSNLSKEIREVMLDDLRLLLRVAKQERELGALNTFVLMAPKLETSLEEDFGMSSEELREDAVEIAKSEVAKRQPWLREGNADASGWLTKTLQEWQFNPQEIGLTAQDMKSLVQ